MARVDGAPPGTRGGISVEHTFAADGDYVFSMDFFAEPLGFLFGNTRPGEEIEVSLDGARLALFQIDPRMSEEKTGLTHQDAADARQGRHASRHGRVHPALRGADQRSDRADRSHDGRHRDRHRAPASPRCRTCAASASSARIASPASATRRAAAASSRAAPLIAGRGNALRRATSSAAWRRRRSGARWREGSRAADDVLRARPQGKEFRGRHHEGARSDTREPAVPVPG